MEKNLTTGSVFKNVVLFSLPYLLSYFLQTLYGNCSEHDIALLLTLIQIPICHFVYATNYITPFFEKLLLYVKAARRLPQK